MREIHVVFVRRIQRCVELETFWVSKRKRLTETLRKVCVFLGWFTTAGQEGKVRKVLVAYVCMKYQEGADAGNITPDST